MGQWTRVTFEGGMATEVRGVPRVARENGRLSLTLGVGPHRGRFDLGALPVGAEVSFRFESWGAFEESDVARLERTEGGVTLRRAYGDVEVPCEGEDGEVPAFEPHALDVRVDGTHVATVHLLDRSEAPGAFLRALEGLAARGDAASYLLRDAARLPWRLPRGTLERLTRGRPANRA